MEPEDRNLENQAQNNSDDPLFDLKDSLLGKESEIFKEDLLEVKVNGKKVITSQNVQVLNQLKEMGFSLLFGATCIYLSKATTIDEVFAYMDSHPNIAHPFVPSEYDVNICQECSKLKTQHRFSSELDFKEDEEENDIENQSNKSLKISIRDSEKKIECKICYEDFGENEIIKFDGKLHDICKSCFEAFLNESIQIGKVLELCCPHCQERLSYKFIQSILSQTVFNKFRKYLLDQLITLDPLMRWCPNSKCGLPIKLRQKFKRKEQCDKCQCFLCTECNREYHSGSCSSYFQKEIKEWTDHSDIQRCEVCKTVIAKIAGCNHMTCKVCQYEWCWLCGGSYDKLHFNDFYPFGCPSRQHSNNNSKCCFFLYKIFMIFLYILVLPFVLAIGVPVVFCLKLSDDYLDCCEKVWKYPLAVILGFILQPIADALFLAGVVPFIIVFLIIQFKKKRDQKKKALKNLTENRALIGLGISRNDLIQNSI